MEPYYLLRPTGCFWETFGSSHRIFGRTSMNDRDGCWPPLRAKGGSIYSIGTTCSIPLIWATKTSAARWRDSGDARLRLRHGTNVRGDGYFETDDSRNSCFDTEARATTPCFRRTSRPTAQLVASFPNVTKTEHLRKCNFLCCSRSCLTG